MLWLPHGYDSSFLLFCLYAENATVYPWWQLLFLCLVNELLEKIQGDINKKFAFFFFFTMLPASTSSVCRLFGFLSDYTAEIR